MATLHTEALVLRAVDFGESDRILHLLVPDGGRLTAIAKGARRSVKRFAGGLDLFQQLRVQLDRRRRAGMARLDHATLLQRCRDWLKPGGVVALAAEPIVPDRSPIVPYPWGPRMDGESLRAMAKFGWMELGFRQSYVDELARRGGWRQERHGLPDNPWAQVTLLR